MSAFDPGRSSEEQSLGCLIPPGLPQFRLTRKRSDSNPCHVPRGGDKESDMAHESEALCAVERVAPSGNRFVPYGLSWDRVVTGWQRALAIVVLVHATLAIGCSRFDEMSWKEQAWLDDGSTVLLDRNARRLSSGFPNARRGPIVHQEIRYAPLKVAWATDGSETPMSFDIVDGSAYLVTIPSVPTASFCAGKPKGAYLANFYVWRDGSQRTISQ